MAGAPVLTAFDRARLAMAADPNRSTAAMWWAGEEGPPLPVRIILDLQDDMAGRGRAATMNATLPRAGLNRKPCRGDRLEFTDQTGARACKVDGIEEPDAWTYTLRLALA